MDFILDKDRIKRTGIPEAIFCQDKPADLIQQIIEHSVSLKESRFFTRLSAEKFSALPPELKERLDYHALSSTAILQFHNDGTKENTETNPEKRNEPTDLQTETEIALLTGGSADLGVAWESKRTLSFMGKNSTLIADIGVAGLWRLMENLEQIRQHKVLIVFAGMEGALPTVLGGMVSQPIIAVPVSTGYGASEGGRTAMHSMLSSCAAGITVVNIDNGYGAACAALRILTVNQD